MQNSLLHKPIEIKISTVVAVSVLLHEVDQATLASALQEMTGGAPDFFDHEFAVIDVAALSAEQLAGFDWPALLAQLRAVNLNPVAVRHAPESCHPTVLELGLSLDEGPRSPASAPAAEPARPMAQDGAAPAPANPATGAQATPAAPTAAATAVATPAAAPVESLTPALATLIIDTPVRAGQRIYARGGDLIITAVVNNGAEVIADGSIHIYAPLRGRALAGASGNPNARIFAFVMEPELLSIAGMYRTFEEGFPANLANAPTQAKLVGDRLDLSPVVIEAASNKAGRARL